MDEALSVNCHNLEVYQGEQVGFGLPKADLEVLPDVFHADELFVLILDVVFS